MIEAPGFPPISDGRSKMQLRRRLEGLFPILSKTRRLTIQMHKYEGEDMDTHVARFHPGGTFAPQCPNYDALIKWIKEGRSKTTTFQNRHYLKLLTYQCVGETEKASESLVNT